jgi:GNAT superfamily N-acetyltransferase
MPSYRFCRTDDIGLLVDALNRCWAPHVPDEPLMTPAAFKRSIRDLQVWCSSCMVAFAGRDPIAVLIGAKRPSATLVHRIAVHPDHRRQGHARHMLASLGSKLAILGPPTMSAEVPQGLFPAARLFEKCGFAEDVRLADYVLREDGHDEHAASNSGAFVIPVTIDDLAANGLLDTMSPAVAWERSHETLNARKGEIEGLAIASNERIEAFVLYTVQQEIVALQSVVADDGARMKELLSRLHARGMRSLQYRKVHPSEIPQECLTALGFRHAGEHVLYSRPAQSGRG